ncbi:MAG: Hsp20/alpha crystallin family protein [Candidatus Methylacidiphilales bacterium]
MMKTLANWDPFQDLERFSAQLSDLFGASSQNRSDRRSPNALATWAPLVDIQENDREYLIKAELPEVEKDNVKVTVENGVLTISGERKLEQEERDAKHHRIERFYGSFARSFVVPDNADGSRISADFKNGVLRVHLPKSEEAKPKQIEIKVS